MCNIGAVGNAQSLLSEGARETSCRKPGLSEIAQKARACGLLGHVAASNINRRREPQAPERSSETLLPFNGAAVHANAVLKRPPL